jgi:hypothetical protein
MTIGLVAAALFTVGAGIRLLNGRSFLCAGLRQVAAGGLAGAVVFGARRRLAMTRPGRILVGHRDWSPVEGESVGVPVGGFPWA